MHRPIRRKERALTEQEALEILGKGEYGILSTVSLEGNPYGVPVNYCLHEGCIVFHSATEGHKLENIEANPGVSFCVVTRAEVQPEEFSTLYSSCIVKGKAEELHNEDKVIGLEALVMHFSPSYREKGLEYIEKLKHKTRVFRIVPESITAKGKKG